MTERGKPDVSRAAPKGMSHMVIAKRTALRTTALRTTALAFSAALLMAACSSGGGGGGGKASESPGTAKAGSGTKVTVTETEYSLTLSRSSFAPGTYTFTADNKGAHKHALEEDGHGVPAVRNQTLKGGQAADVTVTLQKGAD